MLRVGSTVSIPLLCRFSMRYLPQHHLRPSFLCVPSQFESFLGPTTIGYVAVTRSAAASGEDTEARKLAEEIALSMPPPTAVYVLDICRVGDDYRLLELNPFGGADLYDCDVHGIVEAASKYACDHCQNGDF